MPQFSSRIIAGALAAVAIPLLCAQTKPTPQDEPTTFRADTRLVVLHATVVDKSGRLVTNLAQRVFHVFENGVEQPIKKFLREDVPVSMGLIVDNSGSMRTKRLRVEASALALVRASNPEDEVFIVNFNDDAFLDQPFTSDLKELERGLAKIDSRGGTAMRDAVDPWEKDRVTVSMRVISSRARRAISYCSAAPAGSSADRRYASTSLRSHTSARR